MRKTILYILLLTGLAFQATSAAECNYAPPRLVEQLTTPSDALRVFLAGPGKIKLHLPQAPEYLLQANDMLLIRLVGSGVFSSRPFTVDEARQTKTSRLSVSDYVRLLFLDTAPGASLEDRQEAMQTRKALNFDCRNIAYRRIGGVELFSHHQVRANGEYYHSYYVLDGKKVHYLDITGSDELAESIISTLSKRN